MIYFVFAVLAAGANATSSVLQRIANRAEPEGRDFSVRLILDLLHRPVWFAGVGAVILGFLLQMAALASGPLAAVEPVLVLELPFTLVLGSIVFHRPIRRPQIIDGGAVTVGLALLLFCLAPAGGNSNHTTGLEWGVGTALTAALVGGLVVAGRRRRGPPRAALLGLATGVSFGMTAAFMTAVTVALGGGIVDLLTTWQTYAMVAAGITAMFLLQNALAAGTLVAAQPAITLSDPIMSIAWGVALFGERIRGGAWYVGAVAGAVLCAWGTVRLSRLPVAQESAGAPPS